MPACRAADRWVAAPDEKGSSLISYRSRRRTLTAGLGAAAGAAILAVVPAAATAAPTASSCSGADASLAQPFLPWGDANLYRLMPGGSFSDGAPGWTFSGGASIAPVDDPFNLAGGDSPASASLPAGASVQSPFTCVDSSQPTLRLVDAAAAGAALDVQAVYQLAGSATASAPVQLLAPGTSWSPTPIIYDGASVLAPLTGGTIQMSVRLTAIGGPVSVDDVFVDPRMHEG